MCGYKISSKKYAIPGFSLHINAFFRVKSIFILSKIGKTVICLVGLVALLPCCFVALFIRNKATP